MLFVTKMIMGNTLLFNLSNNVITYFTESKSFMVIRRTLVLHFYHEWGL